MYICLIARLDESCVVSRLPSTVAQLGGISRVNGVYNIASVVRSTFLDGTLPIGDPRSYVKTCNPVYNFIMASRILTYSQVTYSRLRFSPCCNT